MGKYFTAFILIFLCYLHCWAGNDNYPSGARSAGVASASVAFSDIWSSANNQAGLAYIEKPMAAFYCESRWNVQQLAVNAGAIAIPVKSTVIGLNYRHFGFSQYSDTKLGLAVAKKLWEKIAIGVQMDYFHTYYAYDYGQFNMLSAEIGIQYEPIKNLKAGAHLFNVTHSRQKANPDEYIPTVMRFGLSYTIKEMATLSVETEKDMRMKAVFKAGLEFKPVGNLYLRYGMSNGLMYQYAFGAGYAWNHFSFDIAFSRHRLLGYSPHLSLIATL